jgi:hypothetical protein
MWHQSTLPQIWAAVKGSLSGGHGRARVVVADKDYRIRSAEPVADRATYHRWELVQGRQPNVMFLLKVEARESQGTKSREGERLPTSIIFFSVSRF